MIIKLCIGVLVGIAMFMILADRFRIPYMRTSKAVNNLAKQQKEKTSSIDVWLSSVASFIARKLRLNEFKKAQLESDLRTAQIDISPEMFVANTSLVLKSPKTETSVRKIFLPTTVANMLVERKNQIDELIELFGDEFVNYNLVFCHSSGRPMEGQVITRALKKLISDNDFPDVVFHSFRHASITYKLKWNGGDMKSVQGDSGHARMDMVADVYSHIIDEDRRYNAQTFEEQFYKAKGIRGESQDTSVATPNFAENIKVLEAEKEQSQATEQFKNEDAELIQKLLGNPDAMNLIRALVGSK